jgi:hypothetical protein
MSETGFYNGRRRKQSGGKFASGKNALAVCERSGFVFPWSEMIYEPGTGYFIHISESDGRYNAVGHPQNFPPKDTSDSESLSHVSKEPDSSTTLYTSVTVV